MTIQRWVTCWGLEERDLFGEEAEVTTPWLCTRNTVTLGYAPVSFGFRCSQLVTREEPDEGLGDTCTRGGTAS